MKNFLKWTGIVLLALLIITGIAILFVSMGMDENSWVVRIFTTTIVIAGAGFLVPYFQKDKK